MRTRILNNLSVMLILSLLVTGSALAQQVDNNRMNRDIRIMENILGEVFKVKTITGRASVGNSFYVNTPFGSSGSIKGSYLPGYGVIFMIPGQNNPFPINIEVSRDNDDDSESKDRNVAFYYSTDDSEQDMKVDTESVVRRMKEFLMDYAPTIGQLKENEKVMLVYGTSKSPFSELTFYTLTGDRKDRSKEQTMPVISAYVNKSDLNAFKRGSLSAEKLDGRITVTEEAGKEYLDLKVMKNIFETALKEVPQKSFRLSGSISYMRLDGFGVMYNMKVRYADLHFLSGDVFFDRDSFSGNNIRITEKVIDSLKEERSKDEAEYNKDVEAAYKQLKDNLSEYLLDYGRTLSSVSSDEYILASLSINDTWGSYELPSRLDLQIKKSVLENLDRGRISRDEALNQITISEF